MTELPTAEFAFPGPLRDRLVAAILDGRKTSTTGLHVAEEPLPVVGGRSVLVDSDGHPVAVLETTAVAVVALAHVPLSHAIDEGEGHRTIEAWRADHEAFWRSEEMRAELGHLDIDDGTPVVLERFRVTGRA